MPMPTMFTLGTAQWALGVVAPLAAVDLPGYWAAVEHLQKAAHDRMPLVSSSYSPGTLTIRVHDDLHGTACAPR